MTACMVVYRREELYDEVWREPATKVAQRYSISSVALGKICRKLCAGAGPRVLGAQYAFGTAPQRPPLPPLHGGKNERRVTRRTTVLDRARVSDSHTTGKAAAGAPILVPRSLMRPHPLVAPTMMALDEVTLRNGLAHPSAACLEVVVSSKARSRALRIMNTLILALEERGLSVVVSDVVQQRPIKYDESAGSTRVLVAGEWIRFQIVEHARSCCWHPQRDGWSCRRNWAMTTPHH